MVGRRNRRCWGKSHRLVLGDGGILDIVTCVCSVQLIFDEQVLSFKPTQKRLSFEKNQQRELNQEKKKNTTEKPEQMVSAAARKKTTKPS